MARVTMLRFQDRRVQGDRFHLTSVDWARNRLPGYHTHDYPEIFWVTRGRSRHEVNATRVMLETGDLVLMRDTDCHQLLPVDRRGFSFTNLSIEPVFAHELMARFETELSPVYNRRDALPLRVRFERIEFSELQTSARQLAAAPHNAFHLERFLLNLWERCLRRIGPADDATRPDWLQDACLKIQEPEFFAGGVKSFVELCGRSHEHVARVCRQSLGLTPSQIVNRARLDRASNELRTTSRSVTEVALDCGFEDPSRFYHLFKLRFGVSPRRYRTGF